METDKGHDSIEKYLQLKAPLVFIRMDKNGIVREMNQFASRLLGEDALGRAFQDLSRESNPEFVFKPEQDFHDPASLLDFQSQSGSYQTYHFHFCTTQDHVLAFGHVDVDEIASMSHDLLLANQELNNLTRLLNSKNRDLKQANATILELARVDPLTKLANRRYFDERLEEMIALTNRNALPLSIIMTDIDKFKNVNDKFGHDSGDLVLQGYAELMRNNTREEDLVARFGGEEFIILLPLTDIRQAYVFSERIRIALSRQDLMGNGTYVTASYGISQLNTNEDKKAFIKRADLALYAAKNSGRNRTCIADREIKSDSEATGIPVDKPDS